MPSNDLLPGPLGPLEITVGFADVPQKAHEHEKRLRFKQSLRTDMLGKIGKVPDSNWQPSVPPGGWGDVTSQNARHYLTQFIQKNIPGSGYHPGSPAGSVCRMTSKGWIKEFTFQLLDVNDLPVTCADTTAIYKPRLEKEEPRGTIDQDAEEQLKSMLVFISIRFTIDEPDMPYFRQP
ncbi:MAG: hypothetical protein IT349_09100 [Candidatus Eisenbacteria bacterium]|nr:hypothetical protein [Candidatus Eisenbacteria bacterium]